MEALRKTLVLLAHPRFEDSNVISHLCDSIAHLPGLRIHDLYEEYPEFNIDVKHEQALLLDHDIIVWMHPVFWYSAPPLLKQWIDLVLTYNWAYGPEGKALQGKQILNCVSAGGSMEAYSSAGKHRMPLRNYLQNFEGTAHICGMDYLPPFVVYESNHTNETTLMLEGQSLGDCLSLLIANHFSTSELQHHTDLKEILHASK
jgi:glutathione-regulated potassium-efflux system ancillary protein KefG